jgi:hypothetical protein
MAGQGRTSGCSRRSCANPGRPAAERWSSQAALDAAQGQSPLQLELLEMATLETQVPFSIT